MLTEMKLINEVQANQLRALGSDEFAQRVQKLLG
jgi:hypothetical protein